MNYPKDPAMLYSFVNMKLRDEYPDLISLCEAMGVSESDLCRRLGAAGFSYDPSANRFV